MTVSGTVTLPDGTPVVGATVTAFYGEAASTQGTTDADGHYALGVEPGTYRFQIRSARTITRWYGGGEDFPSGSTVSVAGARTLSSMVEPGVHVEGTYPATASGVALDARLTTGPTSVKGDFSAADGHFEAWLTTEKPAHVGLRMTGADKLTVTRWNGGTFAAANSEPVQGTSGTSVPGLAFDLPAGVRVSGHVTTTAGVPMRSSVRRYVLENGEWVLLGTVPSTVDGAYGAVLPAGETVSLQTRDLYYEGFAAQWLGNTADPGLATRLSTTSGLDVTDADIAVPGGSSITGTVRDANLVPVPGVSVTAFRDRSGLEVGHATTDELGRFEIPGLGFATTGPATLRFSGSGLVTNWWGGADRLSQDTARLFEFQDDIVHTARFDAEHQLDAPGVPTMSGSGLVGALLTATAAPGDPDATTEELRWSCGSRSLGVVGPSYRVTAADLGCAIKVVQLSRRAGWGSAASASRSVTVGRFALEQGFVCCERTVGQRLRLGLLRWSAPPDRLTYQWLRNGVAIPGATGSTYLQRSADIGREISVRLTGHRTADGISTTRVVRGGFRTRARSYIRVSVAPRRAGGVVTVWVATPGVARPGGEVGILRNGNDHLAHLRITATPQTVRYRLRDWSGRHRLVVYYSGSALAAPVRTTVTFVTR